VALIHIRVVSNRAELVRKVNKDKMLDANRILDPRIWT
jgi:hypothetical protein